MTPLELGGASAKKENTGAHPGGTPRGTYLRCGRCPIQVHPAADHVLDEDRDEHLYRYINEPFSRILAPLRDLIEAPWIVAFLVTGQLGGQLIHHRLVDMSCTAF